MHIIDNTFKGMSTAKPELFTLAHLDRERLQAHCDFNAVFNQFNASIADEIEDIASMRKAGHSPVPEVTFERLSTGGFTNTEANLVRKRGCVVVRETFLQSQVEQWNEELSEYLEGPNQYHKKLLEDIDAGNATRAEHPHMLDIYWSKTQIEVRQSARLQVLQNSLNSLWQVTNNDDSAFDPNRCCTYADRVRIRQPLDENHGLAPHVDSCSMESWFSQKTVERTYAALLSGNWQAFDAFDAAGRVNTRHKPHEESVGMFRTYQGWMALTPQGPDCGTLQLVPSSRCVAWLFLSMLSDSLNNVEQVYPLPSEAYMLHPEKHAVLIKGLCSIPELQAGDTVWWHPDAVHGVEKSNQSSEHSSVIYLGIAPDCERNQRYLQEQLISFAGGLSPPDFPAIDVEKNYTGRALPEHLNQLGAQQMGHVR